MSTPREERAKKNLYWDDAAMLARWTDNRCIGIFG
jgi:hypothetical protein